MPKSRTIPDHVMVDGHRIALKTAGSPDLPPLLMVHGWGSFHGVWRTTIPVLKDHYFCVAIDLLGFGDSEQVPGGDYTIPAQARRVLAVADHFGFEQFNLIGHSMGGQTVLTIAALLAPERVIKLIDVAGVVAAKLMPDVEAFVPDIQLGEKYPFLYPLTRWMVSYRFFARSRLKAWFYDMDAIPFNYWAMDRQRMYQNGGHHAMLPAYHAMYANDLTQHLHNIIAPTLCVFGRQDNVVPVTDGELVAAYVPESTLVWIDNCGHFPMYEKRDEYLDAVRAFLLD